jgi:hypothetical protein
MDAGINNVIYMELYSGPKMANGTCGKTIVTGTIDRGSTVYRKRERYITFSKSLNHCCLVECYTSDETVLIPGSEYSVHHTHQCCR